MFPYYPGIDTPLESLRFLWPFLVLAGAAVVAFDWFVLPTLGVVDVLPVFDQLELLGYALVLGGVVWALGPYEDR